MSGRGQRRANVFWRELPARAMATFLGAVFCLFSSIGFINSIGGHGSWEQVLYNGAYSGVIAVGFAWLGVTNRLLWMIPWGLGIIVGWPNLVAWLHPTGNSGYGGSGFASVGAIVVVMLGYTLFLIFVGTEGRRRFKLEAEIKLAGEIHRGLAPAIERRTGGYEFSGSSQASGQVGGDLLDLVEGDGGWFAYIADVAGHGVAAGVLMGVVKSAVHTWWAAGAQQGENLLPGLNDVLCELLPEESYVTLAALMRGPGQGLRFVAAGHPPLLHFHAASGEVSQVGLENFPLGLFPGSNFRWAEVRAGAGDVLALYTDGLEEIFNGRGGEFGLEGLGTALRQNARRPLAEVAGALVGAARAHGAQTDDQTVLLVRTL